MASIDQITGLSQILEGLRAEIATLRGVGPTIESSMTTAIAEVGQRAMNDMGRIKQSVDDLTATVTANKSILDKTNELLNGETLLTSAKQEKRQRHKN